ncbi:hypothetical protein ACJJTC_012968 [Scirpophaga incertulas]
MHVVARLALQAFDADAAGAPAYYTHLFFEAGALVVEVAHVVHMVVYSNLVVSMASLVLLVQLRNLLGLLQRRLKRHRVYWKLARHMARSYPMASKEEMEKNEDNCAICWEPLKEARKLPCSHLFHKCRAVFPQYPARALAAALAVSRSAAATRRRHPGRPAAARVSVLSEPEEEEAEASSSEPPQFVAPVLDDDEESEEEPVQFPSVAAEREAFLRRRRARLLSTARRRLLQRDT